MPNLILKSNTASNAFYVEQKIIELPVSQSRVELVINPTASHLISAKDFYLGTLPPQILGVNFSDSNNKVIAGITLKQGINFTKNLILDIPIYTKASLKTDRFNIKETTSAIGKVLINTTSPFPKSIINNETNYTINNKLGKKSLIFSKTFTTTNGFKFSKLPKYTITGNPTRYSVNTKTKKDKNNVIISKTFDFLYTSPSATTLPQDTEINFSVSTKNYEKNIPATTPDQTQNVIYSINKGRTIGPEGGIKRISIKGTPGSLYSFIVSNADGLMYDISSGTFSNSGGTIAGEIPLPADGRSYGEAIINIKVPKSSTTQTISTQFISKESTEVQKDRLEKADASMFDKIQGEGKVKQNKIVSVSVPTLVFNITADNASLASTSVVAAEAESVSTELVTLTVDGTAASDFLFKDKKVYKSDGTLFGTCTSVTDSTTLVFGAGITSAIANDDVLYTYPTLYLGPKVKITNVAGATATSRAIFIGDEGRFSLKAEKSGSYPFRFRASSATDDKLVQITRQPLFVMPEDLEDNYVAWDNTEAKKALAQKADGTTIPSDWDWSSVEEGANIKIAMRARGNGKILKTTAVGGVDKYAYSEVIVEGEISVGNPGRVTASLALNLNNFLSIV